MNYCLVISVFKFSSILCFFFHLYYFSACFGFFFILETFLKCLVSPWDYFLFQLEVLKPWLCIEQFVSLWTSLLVGEAVNRLEGCQFLLLIVVLFGAVQLSLEKDSQIWCLVICVLDVGLFIFFNSLLEWFGTDGL